MRKRRPAGEGTPRPWPLRLARAAARLLLAAVLLGGVAVEAFGGQWGIPTWGQLHQMLGVPSFVARTEPLQPQESSVTFLDVGQGDAVLIGQGEEYCLIDAGPAEASEELLAALSQLGITRLQLVVLTHPHADHGGGMEQVLRTLAVGQLLLPPLPPDGQEPWLMARVRRRAEQEGVPVATAEAGQQWTVGEGTLEVLQAGFYPLYPGEEADRNQVENDASLCLRFTAGSFSFLDTGDAERAAEAALVKEYGGALHATLLKAGHHGSSTSNTKELLRAVSPQAVAVSCGAGNDYGHPHASVLRRWQEEGIPYARTDEQGALTYLWHGGKLELYTSRGQEQAPAA